VDANVVIQLGTLAVLIVGFIAQWFREGRAHRWQQAEAEALAKKVNSDATAVALKVSNEVLAAAAKANQDAALLAAKVVDDAAAVADKVLAAADKLAITVTESTKISSKAVTEAAGEAKIAYSEANSQNAKIINLGALIADVSKQVLGIAGHIKENEAKISAAEKSAHDEAVLNERVKATIEGLMQRNGALLLKRRRK